MEEIWNYSGSLLRFKCEELILISHDDVTISSYVFTEILQSLLVCLLSLVIHRCLTLR